MEEMKLIEKEPIIFLICGKARHGKTTTGNFIRKYAKEQGLDVANTYIALYLKTYAEHFFGWSGKDEDKPRELLQKLGTDIIRKKLGMEYFFINRTIEDINILKYFFHVIIIDDIRFPIEIEKIKESFKNVISIKILRENFESELSNEQMQHATETALDNYDNYDYIIKNNGSLEELDENVIDILKEVDIYE